MNELTRSEVIGICINLFNKGLYSSLLISIEINQNLYRQIYKIYIKCYVENDNNSLNNSDYLN